MLCTQEAPCDVCKDWLPEAWEALEKAAQQKRKRKAAAVKKSQEMDDSIEIHAPEEGIQVPPAKRRDDGLSKTKKRAESATSSKAIEAESAGRPSRSRDKKKTLSSSVSMVGRSRSNGGPVPSGTKGSERHRSCSGDRGRQGHGSERRHDSPRSHHSPRRQRCGERTRPTSSGGSSSRARHADPMDAPGAGRASGRATEVRPPSSSTHRQRHHSRSSADRRSRSGSQDHDRRESVDSLRLSYVSRHEVQLSPVAPQQAEKRTITVIPPPPRPAQTDDSAGVTGPADSAALADSAGVTGPTDSAEEPEIVYNSAAVADPAQDQDPAGADSAHPQDSAGDDSAHPQDSAGDDSARGDGSAAQGTPAGTTPVARQDISMVSDVSSLMFPSLPRNINQATLVIPPATKLGGVYWIQSVCLSVCPSVCLSVR